MEKKLLDLSEEEWMRRKAKVGEVKAAGKFMTSDDIRPAGGSTCFSLALNTH